VKPNSLLVMSAAVLATASAIAQSNPSDLSRRPIQHVLLISVDGMHAVDFKNCSQGIAGFNDGAPYCPHLTALGSTGLNYVAASTSKPSDSFPGLMTIVTGATPRTVGIYYDVAYDRSLDAPLTTTGNGLAGGPCKAGAAPTGTTTEYEEGIDIRPRSTEEHQGPGSPRAASRPSIPPGWCAIPRRVVRRCGHGTSSAPTPSSASSMPRVAIPPGRTSTPLTQLFPALVAVTSTISMRRKSIPA
jgi:hypothetical protein